MRQHGAPYPAWAVCFKPPEAGTTIPRLSLVADDEVERPSGGRVAQVDELNLYASPLIPRGDREALERICRYLLRGPLALGRLPKRADGMLPCRLKKAEKRGNTLLVMTPPDVTRPPVQGPVK